MVNNVASTSGNSPEVWFRTTQTLTCTCSGACGGGFNLELDDKITANLAYNINEADLSAALKNLYGGIHSGLSTNIVNVTTLGGGDGAVCVDSSTTQTFIEFKTDSGNLPTLGVMSSLTDGGSDAPATALSVVHHMRGSKEDAVCSGIGTCDYDTGTCDCGDYYTYEDAYGGCGLPIINTSAWTGIETCPGVVLQNQLDVAVPKPSSLARLFFTQGSNKTNTGMHFYEFGAETDMGPQIVVNMTNLTAGALALDLSEGYAYFVDVQLKRIDRLHIYNNTKSKNLNPNSGDMKFLSSQMTASQGTPPSGLALDLRWHNRYAYWTVPGADGVDDGKIKRCPLDKGSNPLCTEEDLSNTIETALGHQLKDPEGIALDLLEKKMYWVDSGSSIVADGKVSSSIFELSVCLLVCFL